VKYDSLSSGWWYRTGVIIIHLDQWKLDVRDSKLYLWLMKTFRWVFTLFILSSWNPLKKHSYFRRKFGQVRIKWIRPLEVRGRARRNTKMLLVTNNYVLLDVSKFWAVPPGKVSIRTSHSGQHIVKCPLGNPLYRFCFVCFFSVHAGMPP